MKATRSNIEGGLVGKTFGEALQEHAWTGSVLYGVISEEVEEGTGVLGNPHRVIKDSDKLMFISSNSTPQVDPDCMSLQEAGTLTNLLDKKTNMLTSAVYHAQQELALSKRVPILVCGWRKVWSVDPGRLKDRMKEIVHGSDTQCSITFMNLLSKDEFEKHLFSFRKESSHTTHTSGLDLNQMAEGDGWVLEGSNHGKPYNIHIYHLQGDAVSERDIRQALNFRLYEAAIVLGTQAGIDLPAKIQDRRVLTICLMIRYTLSSTDGWSKHHMRIVSENNEDQTALLAVRATTAQPKAAPQKSDFVNTQV